MAPLLFFRSFFNFELALDPKSAEFIAWTTKNAMILIFCMIFIVTYCYGRNESYRHDHKIFQRLRLLIILTCFADFWWPFQYYFNLKLNARIIFMTLASSADLLTGIIIILLSLRVFQAYYHTKQYQSPRIGSNTDIQLPWYLYIIIIIFLCGFIMVVITEIVAFSFYTFNQDTYLIILVIWFAINSIYTITLISFLLRMTTLFKQQTAVNSFLFDENEAIKFKSHLQCSAAEAHQLYLKMIFLCTGFILYYVNLLVAYIYLFIKWNFNVSDHIVWIIDHEVVGHFILYCTFWSYLRVRNIERKPSDISTNLVWDDDRVEHSKQVQGKKSKEKALLDKSYPNLYRDLGKLCDSLEDNNMVNENINPISQSSAKEQIAISKAKSTDYIDIDSSFSNTASTGQHSNSQI